MTREKNFTNNYCTSKAIQLSFNMKQKLNKKVKVL